ncbi:MULTISPECIES: TlpA disulfide reductase family protein [Bacillus]|uniref:TlpA disulfide reductase family protein n=1 Tax=Bacillus TaxID=1386 RepID=UPI003872AA89
MNRLKKIIAILFLVGLAGFAVFQTLSSDRSAEVGVAVGDKAMDFELPLLDGTVVRLSDYEGKKVILNFWATWCPPCKAEMPEMQDFHIDNKDNDVVILAVNLTEQDTIAKVNEFVDEGGFTFPILLDEKGTWRHYQVLTMPTTYFIDTEGIIRNKHIGAMTYQTMEQQIKRMN